MIEPKPGQIGYRITPEQKEKMAEGRRRAAEARKIGKAPGPPRSRHKPRLETAPVRAGGIGVTEKMRRKIVDLVARVIQGIDATAVFTLKRIERPVYAVDPTTKKLLLDEKRRPIIEGKVRAVSDEIIAADRLEEWERIWLAEELVNELIQIKPVRLFLIRLVEIEERSSLPMCVVIISLPRLARHGILPAEFTEMIEGLREAARKARHVRGPSEPIVPSASEPEIPAPSAAAD